jgi:outer membrane protein TolC
MSVSILYPEHQYIFNNVQMGLIYDLVCAYMEEAESVEELSLAQETVDSICAQSFGES